MRTSKIVLLVTGIIVLMVAGLWRPVVAPQLTKLPTSLDIKYQFTGTYTGSVNPSTGARLAAPQNLPLSIDRQVKAVPAQSTSSELVVNDASTVVIGPDKTPQILQYVLDRSTAKNVKSPHAYALVPGNVVDRTGSYSLGPPPGADTAKAYPMWVDEIGKTVPITYANATQTVHGVAVQEWQLKLPATPMAASFVSAMHLPTTMLFADFEAQLKAQGTDLALGLKVLSGSLTAAEKTSARGADRQADPAAVLLRHHHQAAGRAGQRHDRGYAHRRPVLFGPPVPRRRSRPGWRPCWPPTRPTWPSPRSPPAARS